MSSKGISTSYTISGCRDGQPVTKIVLVNGENCQSVIFSDLGTETTPSTRIEGACPVLPSTMGGKDFVTTSGQTLESIIGTNSVKSITIIAETNCNVIIDGNTKQLKSGNAYTRSQSDSYVLNLTGFVFSTNGISIESIRENI